MTNCQVLNGNQSQLELDDDSSNSSLVEHFDSSLSSSTPNGTLNSNQSAFGFSAYPCEKIQAGFGLGCVKPDSLRSFVNSSLKKNNTITLQEKAVFGSINETNKLILGLANELKSQKVIVEPPEKLERNNHN